MELHDEIEMLFVLECVLQLSDPGVLSFSHDISFLLVKGHLSKYNKSFKTPFTPTESNPQGNFI